MRAPLMAFRPTPPAPKMTTVSPALTVRGVQDGAGTGYDAAAEERRLCERELLRHHSELVLVDERPLREAAKAEALKQGRSFTAQPRGIGRSTQRRLGISALKRAARQTSSARPARLGEGTHDVVAHPDLADVRTDGSHDARHLVPKHRRQRDEIVRGKQQVGVTQPGCPYVDEHFAADRGGDLDIFDGKSAA